MMNNYEIIGLVASVFVLISFLPKNVTIIRLINAIGCIVWIIYAVFTRAFSVGVMNTLVLLVHIIRLITGIIHQKDDKN